MTVRELIDKNQMIVDADIEVRKDGCALLDALFIGCYSGKKPPHPYKVPVDEAHMNCLTEKREAHYIDKSINAWDDGHDYWQVKTSRIPNKWLDLEVFGWEVWDASIYGNSRRMNGRCRNVNFHGQRIRITALPSGTSLEIMEPKKEPAEDDGQMTLEEWCLNREEI